MREVGPYREMREMRVSQHVAAEGSDFGIEIVLARADSEAIRLVAEGVCNLSIGQHFGPGVQVGPLELEDLRARGWDDLTLRVYDPEQEEMINFACRALRWEPVVRRDHGYDTRADNASLSQEHAYVAMSLFLDAHWKRTGRGDELAALLGDLMIEPDGRPRDLAAWSDWLGAVSQARAFPPRD